MITFQCNIQVSVSQYYTAVDGTQIVNFKKSGLREAQSIGSLDLWRVRFKTHRRINKRRHPLTISGEDGYI